MIFRAVILLLFASLPIHSQPVEYEEIVILLADFDGPDREGIPLTESLFSWIQQVGSEDGTLRVIRMDEVIGITETIEATCERGLEAGADLVVWGAYDLPGTSARIVITVASCVGSTAGSVMHFRFVTEGSFPLSELVPGSEPPERIRFLSNVLAGYVYHSRDDFERGLVYIDKALDYEDSAPGDLVAAAYSLKSLINLQWQEDTAVSLSYASHAIVLDSENPTHYTHRGNCYEMMGELQAALEDYLVVNQLDPSNPENLYNLSRLYQDLGDNDSAIDAITEAILLEPDSVRYLNMRGYIYNNLGDFQAAADDISRSLELNPEYPTGWANLGCAERELGNLTEAILCFGNAIEYQTDPALISSYMLDRGYCYGQLQDYGSAISDYNSALNLYPGTAANYAHLGWLHLQGEDYEDAVVYYDIALQIDCDNPDYLCIRGRCNYHIGETAASIEDLTDAMEIDPDGFTTDDYLALGRAYREEGDFASAISTFSQGLIAESGLIYRSWMLSDRALCNRLAGDLESSLADLDEAIQLNSSEPEYHYRKGEIYYLMNLDDEAIESYDNAIEIGLSGAYLAPCLFQRGQIYLDRESYEKAVQDFTAALESDPCFFDACFFRGLAHYRNGNLDLCRENMERYLQVGTDREYIAYAREILGTME